MPTPDRSPYEERVLRLVGRRLSALRDAAGLTQMNLAAKAGLHYTYIGQIENGRRNLALLNLYSLAAALEVEVGDLLPDHAEVDPR